LQQWLGLTTKLHRARAANAQLTAERIVAEDRAAMKSVDRAKETITNPLEGRKTRNEGKNTRKRSQEREQRHDNACKLDLLMQISGGRTPALTHEDTAGRFARRKLDEKKVVFPLLLNAIPCLSVDDVQVVTSGVTIVIENDYVRRRRNARVIPSKLMA